MLLPILYETLQKEQASHDYRMLEVHMFDTAQLLKDPMYRQAYSAYPPPRDYHTFELTGNATTDKIKLDYAQLRIRDIENTGEVIHGVNFHFSKNAKYGSFVRVFDVLKRENATLYLAAKKDIWFWAGPRPRTPDQPAIYMGCCVCYNKVVIASGHASQLEDVFYRIKPYWPIAVLLLALMLCTVRFFMLQRRPAALKLARVLPEMRRR